MFSVMSTLGRSHSGKKPRDMEATSMNGLWRAVKRQLNTEGVWNNEQVLKRKG
jgi:hypothetical protein